LPTFHDFGEEYWQKTATGDLSESTTWNLGLYDSSDALAEGDDLAAITTEPGNTNYSRQSITVGNITFSQVSGDVVFDIPNQTFDLSDNATTNTVDSWFLVINYQSTTVGSDTAATDHLVMSGSLSQSYTLNNVDNLQVNDAGGSLD